MFCLDPTLKVQPLRAKVDGAPACGITDFTPAEGTSNTSVVITDTNLTGATTVTFNGLDTSFTANSDSQITATVPPGATTGPISVLAAGGLAPPARPRFHHHTSRGSAEAIHFSFGVSRGPFPTK